MENKSLFLFLGVPVTAVVIAACLFHPVEPEISIVRTEPRKLVKIASAEAKKRFTPLQLTLMPGKYTSLTDMNTPVYGMSLGGLVCQQEVNGFSFALAHLFNTKKNGLSMSFFERSGEVKGLSCFLIGTTEVNDGCSLALLNMTEANNGVQVGLINQTGENFLSARAAKPRRPQEEFGVQTGLINYSEGKGIQFGLLNTNPRALIKYMPFFNISW